MKNRLWIVLSFACLWALPLNAQQIKDGFLLSLRYDREIVSAMVGNGTTWRVLKQIPRAQLGGQPIALRVGKLSLQADNRDHAMPGEFGSCRFENIAASGQANPNYHPQFKSEATKPLLAPDKPQLVFSPRPDTRTNFADGALKISANANSAAFGEWLLTTQIMDDASYSVRVWKESDQGLSWGPGLALIWPNGQFILVNARHPLGEWSVTTRDGETLIR